MRKTITLRIVASLCWIIPTFCFNAPIRVTYKYKAFQPSCSSKPSQLFSSSIQHISIKSMAKKHNKFFTQLSARKTKDDIGSEISQKRRQQLGIPDDEREYDLDVALNTNTDPLITKIIAGSFILVVIALLVFGIVMPSLTDYGEGVCSPIQNGGRC
mmetsp:Transcript_5892/g.7517  ORF Transcript_5892/g.7517 Transcript_5892/m.7517 type:complete len:157 (+) Transcript_5892:86-556(+)